MSYFLKKQVIKLAHFPCASVYLQKTENCRRQKFILTHGRQSQKRRWSYGILWFYYFGVLEINCLHLFLPPPFFSSLCSILPIGHKPMLVWLVELEPPALFPLFFKSQLQESELFLPPASEFQMISLQKWAPSLRAVHLWWYMASSYQSAEW